MKPLGYYVNNNNPTIKELEQGCGSYLENLTTTEKLFLLSQVADFLLSVCEDEVDENLESHINSIDSNLNGDEKLGLIDALVQSLRD